MDEEANRQFDFDTQRGPTFSMIAVGWTPAEPPPPLAEMRRLGLEIVLLSRKEVDYPVLREMHAASSFTSAGRLYCLLSLEDKDKWREVHLIRQSPDHQ